MFFARRLVGRQIRLCRASSSTSQNAALIEKLQQFIQEERRQEAPLNRIRVLVQGVDFLSKLPYKLTSREMAELLPVAGAFTKVLVDHLPSTSPSDVTVISEKERKALVKELTVFDGINSRRASQLIKAGCRTKDDLLDPKYFSMLPETIQCNVRFASHIKKPVTRQQTENVVDFVRDTFPKYEIIPVGSYRRGSLTSSCARLLIIHPDMHHITPPPPPPVGYFQPLLAETLTSVISLRDAHLHNTIMPLLIERGLAFAPRVSKSWSWIGILRVPQRVSGEWETSQQMSKGIKSGDGEFVRGRFFLLPSKSRGAAILCYTGSQPFLRLMKYKAAQLGLYLDHTGLWQWHPAPTEDIVGKFLEFEPDIEEDEEEGKPKPIIGGKKNLERELANGQRANGFWQLLPSTNEEVIFEQLGMEYVDPERRK